MNERAIQADGIELATQAFGDPGWPPALLIMGVMASMLWLPDAFCERLSGRGRHVLREGGGHELHEADWDEIIGSIVEHTGG